MTVPHRYETVRFNHWHMPVCRGPDQWFRLELAANLILNPVLKYKDPKLKDAKAGFPTEIQDGFFRYNIGS